MSAILETTRYLLAKWFRERVRVRVRVRAGARDCITFFFFLSTKCGENLLFVGWIASGCI